jgi:hypothetical protein
MILSTNYLLFLFYLISDSFASINLISFSDSIQSFNHIHRSFELSQNSYDHSILYLYPASIHPHHQIHPIHLIIINSITLIIHPHPHLIISISITSIAAFSTFEFFFALLSYSNELFSLSSNHLMDKQIISISSSHLQISSLIIHL